MALVACFGSSRSRGAFIMILANGTDDFFNVWWLSLG